MTHPKMLLGKCTWCFNRFRLLVRNGKMLVLREKEWHEIDQQTIKCPQCYRSYVRDGKGLDFFAPNDLFDYKDRLVLETHLDKLVCTFEVGDKIHFNKCYATERLDTNEVALVAKYARGVVVLTDEKFATVKLEKSQVEVHIPITTHRQATGIAGL